MAKKSKGLYAKIEHEPVFHKTSIGRKPSLTKMNKSKVVNLNFTRDKAVDKYQIISYILNMKGVL
jgi:hypothetical protein